MTKKLKLLSKYLIFGCYESFSDFAIHLLSKHCNTHYLEYYTNSVIINKH